MVKVGRLYTMDDTSSCGSPSKSLLPSHGGQARDVDEILQTLLPDSISDLNKTFKAFSGSSDVSQRCSTWVPVSLECSCR